MLTKKENLAKSRIRLTLKANAAEFRKAFDRQVVEIGKSVKIEGFRPGKAPEAKIIEKVGRTNLEAEALEEVLSKTYRGAVREAQIFPTDTADLKIIEFKAPGDDEADETEVVTFTAETDVYPEVKIDGYKKIRVKDQTAPVIKEDEVERVIEYLRKQRATIKEAEPEAVLKKGMWVDIAYEGSVDGVKRTDMVNKNHPLVLGEGQLIPGFEEEIYGLTKGQVHTFSIIFPKDYHAKELAGKKAEFTVTVNDLKEVVLPELDAEFAKAYGHDSVEQLTEAIRSNLKEEKEQESRQALEEQVLEQLLKVTKVEMPSSLLEQELERMFAETRERLEKMQFNWETYLAQTGKSIDSLREEMRPQAEKRVRIGMALGQLIKEEGITDKTTATAHDESQDEHAHADHEHHDHEGHEHHHHEPADGGANLIAKALDRLMDIAIPKK